MSISVKHVNAAMQTENSKTQNEVLDAPSRYNATPTPAEPPKVGYVIFRLVNKKQRRLWIDGICDNCLNPKTGEYERTYLIRGAKSIWQSDLTELIKDMDKPSSYISKNRIGLLFEDGICRIPATEKNQLEFARVNIHNVGKNRTGSGKFDYYEYDPAEESRYKLEKQMSRIKLLTKINEMPDDKIKKLAAFLEISLVDELGFPKSPDGVKGELLVKADVQPHIVEKFMDSREVEIQWLVRRAIIDAKIDLTAQAGNAVWAGGKGFIAKIPSTRKAYEYLTELAMTNSDEGRQFKEQLEQMAT